MPHSADRPHAPQVDHHEAKQDVRKSSENQEQDNHHQYHGGRDQNTVVSVHRLHDVAVTGIRATNARRQVGMSFLEIFNTFPENSCFVNEFRV